MFVTQVEAAGRRRYGKRETPVTGGDEHAMNIERGRRSVKNFGAHTSGAHPLLCRRRCGEWTRGKTRGPQREGAEVEFHAGVSSRLLGGEVGTLRSVHDFLCSEVIGRLVV